MVVNIGEMNKRIKLLSSTKAMDYGEEIETWDDYATVWGGVKPLSANERTVAAQISAVATHRIKIRPRSDVMPNHRVQIGNKIYEINGILDYTHINDGMYLLCSEVVQ